MNLEESLQECTLALLRRIAASHSIASADDTLRSELATLIIQRLAQPAYLESYYQGLPPEEKSVLQYLASHTWEGKAFLLERQFPRRGSIPSSISPCASLLQKGILYRSFGVIDSWRGEIYHVPADLRQAIVTVEQSPGVGTTHPLPSAGEPLHAGSCDGPLDLFALLSFLHRGERRVVQGYLGRQDLARLEQERPAPPPLLDLHGGESRWRFLLRLCLGGGWVWRDGPVLKPGRGAVQVLSGSRHEVRRRMVERYLKDRAWSDLESAGRVRQHLGGHRIDEAGARQIVLHYLREWAPDGWVNEETFRDAVRATNPDFLREDYAALGSAVVDSFSDTELSGPESWDAVEGEWLRFVLRGPFCWLGLLDWGTDSMGNGLVFRLIGDDRLTEPGSDMPRPAAPFSFSAEDLSVLASWDADISLLYQLEPYLVLRRSEPGGRSYRFTSASVHRGLEGGGSWEELRQLIQRSSGGQIPARVLAQVEEWAHSYDRLVLEGAILLTAATETDLEETARLPEVATLLGERVGPRSYRVADRRFWQLLSILKQAGVPPKIDPSVGSMRARHATGDPSLLRESLFAIMLLRALHGPLDIESGFEAQRVLEAALGPEVTDDITRRVQDAVQKLRRGADSGW